MALVSRKVYKPVLIWFEPGAMLRRGYDSSNIAIRLAVSHSGNSNGRVTILYFQEL
jgi:hypothetical protein